MDGLENTGHRESRIPNPVSGRSSALQLMNESQHNARLQPSTMRPIMPSGIKRPGFEAQSQPEPKRQTLAERAGDYDGKRSTAGIPLPTSKIGEGLKAGSMVSLAAKQGNNTIRPFSALSGSARSEAGASSRIGTLKGRTVLGFTGATSLHPPKQSSGGIRSRATTAASKPRPGTAAGQPTSEDADEGPAATTKQQNGIVEIPPSFQSQRFLYKSLLSQTRSQDRILQSIIPQTSRRVSPGALLNSFHALEIGDQSSRDDTASAVPSASATRRECTKPHEEEASAEKPGAVTGWNHVEPLAGRDKNHNDWCAYASATSISTSENFTGLGKQPEHSKNQHEPSNMTLTLMLSKPLKVVFAEMAKIEISLSAAKKASPTKAKTQFMTKDSNARGFSVLDVDERLRDVESQFSSIQHVVTQSLAQRNSLEELVEISKSRVSELQQQRDCLEGRIALLQSEAESLRSQLQSTTLAIEGERREQAYKMDDLEREHRRALDDLRREHIDGQDKARRAQMEALEALERRYKADNDEQKRQAEQKIQNLQARLDAQQQDLDLRVQEKAAELQKARVSMAELQDAFEHERLSKTALQKRMAETAASSVETEERVRMLQAQVDFLKSDCRQQSDQYAAMEARMQQALKVADEARQRLIKEETERRILFNKYQELKGNIRVMCRVRPAMEGVESDEAVIGFPDASTSSSQIEIVGPEEKSSFGVVSRKTMPFEFDRVFSPSVQNPEVFDEISQLVQSALDGYNVCIFCYGQTGSGKTYTMSSVDGMIPRATHMIYENIKRLEEKSWSYTMEGSFVEVYNEELYDLLGGAVHTAGHQDPKKKLEIRHDEARKTTTVVGCKSVRLDSSDEVEKMLCLAQSNRSVAATKANERSSRSHSIFILKLVGQNTATGEHCEGTLNLVDLAGSERLKHSGAEGERKKETQSINKSLSCLGDVIEALGRGAPHVPYRNSKLTHLLQYSLGGNSKTLMFVMVSPLEIHLKETLTSLRFATKVHNTHIGTAKSTKKVEK